MEQSSFDGNEMETPIPFQTKYSTIIFVGNFSSFYNLFIIWVEQMSEKAKQKQMSLEQKPAERLAEFSEDEDTFS